MGSRGSPATATTRPPRCGPIRRHSSNPDRSIAAAEPLPLGIVSPPLEACDCGRMANYGHCGARTTRRRPALSGVIAPRGPALPTAVDIVCQATAVAGLVCVLARLD